MSNYSQKKQFNEKLIDKPAPNKLFDQQKKRIKDDNKEIFMDMPSGNSEDLARKKLEKYRPYKKIIRVHYESITMKRKPSEEQAAEKLRKYAPGL